MLRRIASKLWPKHIAPGLRSQLVKLRSKSAVRLHFELWRRYSHAVYGKHRPITAHGAELVARSNDWRAFWVHKQGGSQRELLVPWQRLIELEPQVCIDVGANYGEFSAPIADQVEALIAVEANPVVFECLERTLADTNATAVNVAASDEPGEVTIFAKDDLSGYSSLAREVMSDKTSPVGTDDDVTAHAVEATTLDKLVRQTLGELPRSVVMKVDVEGFEQPVLEGATQLLGDADWWRAVIEFSISSIGSRGADPKQFWEWLRQYNGIILDESVDGTIDFRQLDDSLPSEMPDHANLVIGQGTA